MEHRCSGNICYFCIMKMTKTTIGQPLLELLDDRPITYWDGNIYMSRDLPSAEVQHDGSKRDMVVFLLCLDGRLHVDINGSQIEVCDGDVLICRSLDTLKDGLFSSDFRCVVCGVSHSYAARLFVGGKSILSLYMFIDSQPLLRLGEEQQQLLQIYAQLFKYKLFHQDGQFFKETLESMMQMATLELFQLYLEQQHTGNIVDIGSDNPLMKKFLLLLGEDNCRHHTVSYFADQLCVTPKYLSIVCKRESGKSPSDWIHEMLTERIRHLLLHTDMTVKEISYQLDFPTLSFFGKYVRQRLGMSPTDYRRENR